MKSFEEIKTGIKAGLGKVPCDLKLKDVQLVNVYSSEIYVTDIYIKNKRIISIDKEAELKAEKVINCKGQYALPGLIDSHIHFEPTLLSPEALGEVMVPHGTTTICVDVMEIANVAGIHGVKAMLNSIENLPYKTFIEVSSRVPTAPGLETTGGVLGVPEVEELLEWDESVSLGELDPSKILLEKDEYLKKIEVTLRKRKIVNGHAIGRTGQELNTYIGAGISDDHECINYEELLERIRLGMTVMIREGSTERNTEKLIKGVIENKLGYEHLVFCTDDKHASEIRNEGHINYNINKAISLGVPPIKAIQMATINPARHFRIEDQYGSITPGRIANILLVDNLKNIKPNYVFYEGKIVARNGELTVDSNKRNYPQWIKETVKLKNPITSETFKVRTNKNTESVTVNVIKIYKDQIINDWLKVDLTVSNNTINIDKSRDIIKLAVVERYGKTGETGIGFVKGFNLQKGALASSLSHDHHNIVCCGTNDEDMALAVNSIYEMQGGLVVVENNKILAKMPLPIGGLMSEKSADEVINELNKLNKKAKELGCNLPAPFMSLSFISLPTVPELGLTDKGLVDVINHKLVDLEV